VDWLGWLHAGWSLSLSYSRRRQRRLSPAVAAVGVLAAALVSTLVVERTLLVDAAAQFGLT